MYGSTDTKEYLTKREIPQLFECLMTGLLYHRPKDHISYLQDCLEKIKHRGVSGVKWDLFLESKGSHKVSLPPISREASQHDHRNGSASSQKQSALPDIHPQNLTSSNNAKPSHSPAVSTAPVRPLSISADADIILAIGGPGSDRNRYCRLMVQAYPQLVHLSMRDVLSKRVRDMSAGSEKARKQWKIAESLLANEEMVQDDLALDALVAAMNEFPKAEGFIIDGFPKNKKQYADLLACGVSVRFAFLVDCEEDHLRQVLLERAKSDKLRGVDPTNIARRLNQFKSECLPLCKMLDDSDRLYVVEGEKSRQEILDEILDIFKARVGPVRGNVPRPPSTGRSSTTGGRHGSASYHQRRSRPTSSRSQLGDAPDLHEESEEMEELKLQIPLPVITVPDTGRLDGLPRIPIILVMGAPGSGRSEQVQRLCWRYGNVVGRVDAAELARQDALNPADASHSLETMASLVTRGELEPEVENVECVVEALKKCEEAGARCIFLEGYPRNQQQLNDFNQHIGGADLVILLDCEEFYLTNRLMKRGKDTGRIDDNLSAIGRKIRFFKENTLPIVRHYDEDGKLVVVLGDRDFDEILYDLCRITDVVLYGEATPGHENSQHGDQHQHHHHLEPGKDDDLAASLIQAGVRGYLVRKEIAEKKEAATKIQASFRGYQTRKHLETEGEVLPHHHHHHHHHEPGHQHHDDHHSDHKEKLKHAKVVFVLGGPGSGKGTQCVKLVEKYGFNHLSSGDLLRAEVESGSPRGQKLKEIMERGELVPLETVLELLRDAMLHRVDANDVFLIDGYPRELTQGVRFEEEVCPCACVFCFNVSEAVMKERLLKRGETSGRVDDNEETILKRLDTFNQVTKPVIEHYQQINKVALFDASGSIEEIFQQVCAKVDSLQLHSKK